MFSTKYGDAAQAESWRELAYARGKDAAETAATWTTEFANVDPDGYRKTLRLMADGEDVEDRLPRRPDLSGEWAGDLTPARLAAETLGQSADELYPLGEAVDVVDALAEEFERGVSEHFESACESELRKALGLPDFSAFHITEGPRGEGGHWQTMSEPGENLRSVLEGLALDDVESINEDYLEIRQALWVGNVPVRTAGPEVARVVVVLGTGGPHVELDCLFDHAGRPELVQLNRYWSGHEWAKTTDTRALDVVSDWVDRFLS